MTTATAQPTTPTGHDSEDLRAQRDALDATLARARDLARERAELRRRLALEDSDAARTALVGLANEAVTLPDQAEAHAMAYAMALHHWAAAEIQRLGAVRRELSSEHTRIASKTQRIPYGAMGLPGGHEAIKVGEQHYAAVLAELAPIEQRDREAQRELRDLYRLLRPVFGAGYGSTANVGRFTPRGLRGHERWLQTVRAEVWEALRG